MSDFEPASDNPFEQMSPDKAGILPPPVDPQLSQNPFSAFNPYPEEDPRPVAPKTTSTSAFGHGVARGALPALGSLPAIGAGAELGAAAGTLGGPLSPFTIPAGAIIGGLAGGIGGATAISAAQSWALSKLPDSWRETIGQDDRQQRLEEAQHPTASFLGGLAPYAITMRPGAITRSALPENATSFQRIMANPVTARVFGGALMGGMELGQEALHGESPDWTKVAISTGFGLVFNKPTRLGERLTEVGAQPARVALGREAPAAAAQPSPGETAPAAGEVAPAAPAQPVAPAEAPAVRYRPDLFHEPTVAQAADAKVAGPGITEDVFQGAHAQSDSTALTAQDTARTEKAAIGEPPAPDIHAMARQMHPDTFAEYDALLRRRETFREWAAGDPGVTSAMEAAGVPHENAAKMLAKTEAEIDKIAPDIAAAYRRAADATATQTVAEAAGEAAPPAAPVEGAQPGAPVRPVAEQRAAIAADVERQLTAAGRPAQEATAAAQLIAARYVTRAARFNGALGTAEELYTREGAEIRGGRGTSAPVATGPAEPPPLPTNRQELADYLAKGGKVEGAKGERELAQDNEGSELFQKDQAPTFYSAVTRALDSARQEKASPDQWLATLRNIPGVKQEELQWLGLSDWLKEQKGSVTRQQVQDYVRANNIEVKEVERGTRTYDNTAPDAAATAEHTPEWDRLVARRRELTRGDVRAEMSLPPEQARTLQEIDQQIDALHERMVRESLARAGGEQKPTKFASYTLPGGENYRELLLTLPEKPVEFQDPGKGPEYMTRYGAAERAFQANNNPNTYRSSHWDEPNILSHIRFNDRTIDGKKTLFIEEIQSDWHQAGKRRGYAKPFDAAKLDDLADGKQIGVASEFDQVPLGHDGPDKWQFTDRRTGQTEYGWGKTEAEARSNALEYVNSALRRAAGSEGVPDAPFKTTWPELAFKRMIRYAAENGYEKIAWTPGEVQAERYDLSKHLTEINVVPSGESRVWWPKTVNGQDFGSVTTDAAGKITKANSAFGDVVGKNISDVFGKDVADRGLAAEKETRLSGVDLKVGGEGMKGFYDKILPATVNKLVKKYGAKVEPATLGDTAETHGWDIHSQGGGYQRTVYTQAEAQSARDAGMTAVDNGAPDTANKTVHAIDLTEPLRDAAMEQGFPLFQGARGKILIRENQRPVITLMRDANASTFIHETGHDFLEQMMRDAQHPQAPGSLRDDADAIVSWLGVKSSEDIKTKQHEKFARGFEQYVREGVAPTPELAGVFSKFKQWLLNIYQTIKGLGHPINDDIRRVFDRMLATEPNRTVIAPEREATGPTIHEIHENEAAQAAPHEADAAHDLVVTEQARYILELPAEVRRELDAEAAKIEAEQQAASGQQPGSDGGAAEPAGQAEPVAGGTGQVVQGGGLAEPVAPGGGGGAQPHALEPSRGDAGAEGAGPRDESAGSGGQAAPDATRDQPLAPSPAANFGARESPFIDRAGNIRVENLTSREDVAQAIRDAAKENNNFFGDRRGVITDGQMMELADAVGIDVQQLNQRKIGEAFNAETILSARMLLIKSATEVSSAMKNAAIGTDEDVLAYALAKDRHQMIQGAVAQMTAEAGRALRAFRSLAGQEAAEGVSAFVQKATGKTLFQLREEAKLGSALESPQQVSKFMNDANKPTFGKMILEYWINGLISGPATHVTYMVGNTILALEKLGPETAAAAMIGRLRKAFGREGETVRLGEVAAQLKGALQGASPALKASIDAFRTGVTTLLPGETPRTMPLQPGAELATAGALDEAAKFTDVLGSAFGVVRGIKDGFISGAGLLAAGGIEGSSLLGARYSQLGSIPDITLKGVNVLPVGTAIRLPGRFIAAIHSLFRSVNYSMEKNAIAYRTASEEGLAGTAFDARVGDIRNNPSADVMEKSRFGATELTLMGQGSQFTKALSRLTNTNMLGFPLLKFIDPFVHISGNIIEQSIIQRTPVGLLAPELRADLMGRNGTIAQDTAQARMLVGTALSITFGSLAAEGYASGSGPKDPKESAMWRLAGNQAHSVRIGDIWYDVHRLGPLGMLMGIGADMYEVAHQVNEGEYTEAAAHFQHAVTQNILDESFMRGPADLIKAIEDPGRYGEAYIRNFLSSFVPYSVGMSQVARAADPYSRQARTIVDAMKAKVPGLSQTLMPRRDIWGEMMPNKDALGLPGLTAIYEQHMSHDPVNAAMLDLGINPGQVSRKIRNVDLTDEQFDDFARIAGRTTKMRLDQIVKAPDYQMWPNHTRHDVIAETIKQSREAARGLVMMRYPQIIKDATAARLEKFQD